MAGHSLGEFSALVAAGCLDFKDAVDLVKFRAEAMQAAVPQGQGGMAAILGLEDIDVAGGLREAAAGRSGGGGEFQRARASGDRGQRRRRVAVPSRPRPPRARGAQCAAHQRAGAQLAHAAGG